MLGEEKKCHCVTPVLTQRNRPLWRAKGKGGKAGGIVPGSDLARIIRCAKNRLGTLAQEGRGVSFSFVLIKFSEAAKP